MSAGWTPLSRRRRPTAAEQALLDRLVSHVDCPELAVQAGSAWVTGVCECGCPSVLLHSDAPALTPETMTRLSSLGRSDWFAIDSTRVDETVAPGPSTGQVRMLQVIVHVVGGSLDNLEIYAADGVAVDLPSPDTLDDITVT
jgi:CTP:molybdopterin cytidylyltransferase MocA